MKKLIVLMLMIFLISGCSIDYNLEIKNNSIIEDRIIWYSKDETDNPIAYTLKKFYDYGDNGDSLYSDNTKILKYGDKIGGSFRITYNSLDDYKNSSIAYGSCFDNVDFHKDNKYIYLDITGRFSCYNISSEIDNVSISIKTNHKSVENNADKFKNNTYTWNIDKDNTDNVNIHLKLHNKKYVYNYDNSIFKRLGVIFLIICVTIVLWLFGRRFYNNYLEKSERL